MDEKILTVAPANGAPAFTRAQWYRYVRWLRRIGPVRSLVHFAIALEQMLRDPWASPQSFHQEFARAFDPWDYQASPIERARFATAISMLDGARGGTRFRCAFEIGCAEGAFTELLAPRCGHLLAVDAADLALERVRTELPRFQNVTFARWDLRRDPVLGGFDLIVAMDVLDCIFRPLVLRAVCAKLITALSPDGLLLVTDPRQSEIFESAWWARPMLRGGKRILEFLARDARLIKLGSEQNDTHVFGLFRKRP